MAKKAKKAKKAKRRRSARRNSYPSYAARGPGESQGLFLFWWARWNDRGDDWDDDAALCRRMRGHTPRCRAGVRTVLSVEAGHEVFNGALYNLQYDLVKDLEPIALLPSNFSVIVTKKDVPAKNLKELVAWLKDNPKQASAATAGIGSIAHVASVYFENKTGVALQIVLYRSGAAAFSDVLAGHVTLIFDQFTGGSVELYRSGQVRPFAVTAKSRLQSLHDIPTVDEAGIPGLYVSTWYGLWAPKGTPKEIVAKLNAAVVEALGLVPASVSLQASECTSRFYRLRCRRLVAGRIHQGQGSHADSAGGALYRVRAQRR